MNCPQCGAAVADGTSICPSCDHILDASFLSAEPPERDVPAPTRPRVPSTRSEAGRTGARRAAPRQVTGARSAVELPDRDATQIKSIEELERSRPSTSPRLRQVPDELPDAQGKGAEAFFEEARELIAGLNFPDKLAFMAASFALLTAFLPWKETREDGEVIGLMSLGFPAFLAGIATLWAIAVRAQRSLPNLSAVVPWLAQLGSVCFALVWSLVFIRLSWDGQKAPALFSEEVVAVSRPVFGVYLAVLAQAVALLGTLLGLKEKPA